MNLLLGFALVAMAAAVTIASMLMVRRRAPEGSYFTDGDRASGVFGVLATGFSVLLGFIIFLGFQSYDNSRSGAETEAIIVAQQVQTAQFLPGDSSQELTGELTCYARSVAGTEWDALDAGTLGDSINPWGAEMFKTISGVNPRTAPEQSAYDRWMSQTADREQARIDRVHGAEGIIPLPLWLVLMVISGVIFRLLALLRRPGRGRGHAGGSRMARSQPGSRATRSRSASQSTNQPSGSRLARHQSADQRARQLSESRLASQVPGRWSAHLVADDRPARKAIPRRQNGSLWSCVVARKRWDRRCVARRR